MNSWKLLGVMFAQLDDVIDHDSFIRITIVFLSFPLLGFLFRLYTLRRHRPLRNTKWMWMATYYGAAAAIVLPAFLIASGVPLMSCIVGLVILAGPLVGLLIITSEFPASRFPKGKCGSCGYDLTGNVSGKCPECGTIINISSPR
jgi:amino acid transporter